MTGLTATFLNYVKINVFQNDLKQVPLLAWKPYYFEGRGAHTTCSLENLFAEGWQKGGRWLADGWQMAGRRVVEGWQMAGRRMADGWQMAGRRVADSWQIAGRRVADGWQTAGRWVADG